MYSHRMTDALLERAKADLADIAEKIAALRDKERKLRLFVAAYDDATLPLPLTEARGEGKTQKDRIANAVVSILSDGQPRHTRELLALLEAQGLRTGSRDQVIGLSTLLNRDSRFASDRKRGWSLKTNG